MNAKQYLDQARHIDRRIQSKIDQIEKLNDIATRVSPVYSDMPKAHDPFRNPKEEAILAILDLKEELEHDLAGFISLKKEISDTIGGLEDAGERTVLEMRYLCFMKFEDIAAELGYSIDSVYRFHRLGLKNIVVPES